MTRRLLHGDVRQGDTLPELRHPVSATTVVLGALATRDWRPQHHDYHFVTQRNGVRDIFLNAPNQAAWLERYVTDWTGPTGRIGRLGFRMRDSVFPGEDLRLTGEVAGTRVDAGCGWVDVALRLHAGDRLCTTATATVALPVTPDDNPWARAGTDWRPGPGRGG